MSHRLNRLVICLMGILCFSGCHLDARRTSFYRYHAADDSFSELALLTNIYCARDTDVDQVESLWKRRSSIVLSPIWFLSAPAIERLGTESFRWTDLSSAQVNDAATIPGIDFYSIQIVPGEFYQNREGYLCYFHQVKVPGKALDAILMSVAPELSAEVAKMAAEQRKKSRRCTWNEFRTSLIDELEKQAGLDAEKRQSGNGSLPLDSESLDMLKQLSKENPIKLSRERDCFLLTIPLSTSDSKECLATLVAYRTRVAQLVQEGRLKDEGVTEFMEAISLKEIEGRGLEILVDFGKVEGAAHIRAKKELTEPPSKPDLGRYVATVKSIQQRGIPVRPSFSVDDLIETFLRESSGPK